MERKIIKWIGNQVKKTKTEGVVLGLSGGVDSAVAAALCLRALGKNKILCLILPCFSGKDDLGDARIIAARLKVRPKILDLGSAYKACLKVLPEGNRLSCGNLKARLRMSVIYYFANKLNYLVCGSSNKSERLVGYFSKYGDGAADILPLGDLLKTQIRELAEALDIPRKIIDKAPSAGFWTGQTDEGELGFSYCQLDDILFRLSRQQKQTQAARLVDKVKFRIKASEHKRRLPLICHIGISTH